MVILIHCLQEQHSPKSGTAVPEKTGSCLEIHWASKLYFVLCFSKCLERGTHCSKQPAQLCCQQPFDRSCLHCCGFGPARTWSLVRWCLLWDEVHPPRRARTAHATHTSLQLYFGHLKWSFTLPQQEQNCCSPGTVVKVPPALVQSARTRLKSPRSP